MSIKRFRIPDNVLFWFVTIGSTAVLISGSILIGISIGHG